MRQVSHLGFFLAFTVLSFGQASGQQSFAPGTAMVGGLQANCGNVWTTFVPSLGDWGRAVPGNEITPPQILIDPFIVGQLPWPVQRFIYAHECAHHIIGPDENAADCWAARMGNRQRWFSPSDMRFLIQSFQWSPGDWTHAPGPVRLQNIWSCYSS